MQGVLEINKFKEEISDCKKIPALNKEKGELVSKVKELEEEAKMQTSTSEKQNNWYAAARLPR